MSVDVKSGLKVAHVVARLDGGCINRTQNMSAPRITNFRFSSELHSSPFHLARRECEGFLIISFPIAANMSMNLGFQQRGVKVLNMIGLHNL